MLLSWKQLQPNCFQKPVAVLPELRRFAPQLVSRTRMPRAEYQSWFSYIYFVWKKKRLQEHHFFTHMDKTLAYSKEIYILHSE